MATLVLAAAGTALGGAMGGVLGGGMAAAAAPVLGRALGAVAGSLIDQALLGGGARAVEGPRASTLRLQGSREGTAIPRVFGRVRVAGTVIWASRFRETVTETRAGGKGTAPAATRRDYRYSVSLALALCEGPVDRIGRIWADGHPVDPESLPLRLHHGGEDQRPDPLIAALEGEGNAPAFRGTAYIVLDDLPLGAWGNRVPQFSVEVFREARVPAGTSPQIAPSLRALVQGVALSPGSGEFVLDTEPVLRRDGPGRAVWENVHGPEGRADLMLSLDQLEGDLPACRSVLLVASWFGDDLRMGRCTLRPGVEEAEKVTEPRPWIGGGVGREAARRVSRTGQGRPVYGGTPSDRGVVQAIREMRARGLRVVFYPFLLMDIPPGNGLPDPYGGAEQAAFPWRGRITLGAAPGRPGSSDGTAAAAAEVAALFGTATAGDFMREGEAVRYAGAPEWSLRRMVLHYAHLCAAAGGVDAFVIGSELRGVTTARDDRGYPAVEALRALAAEVRKVLGPGTALGYAADWSEYFGHQPGNGDVRFHLDPLWADPVIDFVGIDNYLPLADWREGADHLDAVAADSRHDIGYLRGNVEGGELHDWYYASGADRAAQIRTPVTDGAHGEPWVFAPKAIRGWWENAHHERIGGVRQAAPTAWVPRSKPVWFTELGCAAVDKGANQPNVFLDPKSAESALPHFSTGAPDPYGQRRFLQAVLSYWADPDENPVSPVYGGPMVEPSAIHVWTWDARRWPEFPALAEVWGDAAAHRTGHWLTGRIGPSGLAETVAEICRASGVEAFDVAALHGLVEGYALDRVATGRAALQPLMLAFAFDAVETAGVLRFVPRGAAPVAALAEADMVARREGGPLTLARGAGTDAPEALRLGFLDAEADQAAAVEASHGAALAGARVEAVDLPLALPRDAARALVRRFLDEAGAARETARFALPPDRLALEPGDVVTLETGAGPARFRLDRVMLRAALEVEATRAGEAQAMPAPGLWTGRLPAPAPVPPVVVFLDLPLAEGRGADHEPWLGVFAEPWAGPVAVHGSAQDDGYRLMATVERPATLGVLAEPLGAAEAGRWWRGTLAVRLHGGSLAGDGAAAVLDGAGLLAVESAPGTWEVIQFAETGLEAPRLWRLSGLLRGQGGSTAAAAPVGARVVRIDGALVRLPIRETDLGVPLHWRVGAAARGYDAPGTVHFVAAANGAALQPLAPVHGVARRENGGVVARWVRRSRLDADTWAGHEPPLGEAAEAWRVQVWEGARLLHEAVTGAPAFACDAAALGGAAGPLRLRVAQLSATMGAGAEMEIGIDG